MFPEDFGNLFLSLAQGFALSFVASPLQLCRQDSALVLLTLCLPAAAVAAAAAEELIWLILLILMMN